MKPPKPLNGTQPKFEVALQELEEIVAEMETAELPLEKLIERYERGIALVKVCGEKLTEAEQKVEILTKSKAAAEAAPEKKAKPSKGDGESSSEVSLF